MARVRLTKRLVDDFSPPETGQAFLWDAEIPGFGVRVTKQGGKAWIVQCRVRGGKQRRIVIGRCNKLALDRARIEARKIIGAAELGQDPAQERREAREVKPDTDPSFGDFADRWLDEVVATCAAAMTSARRLLICAITTERSCSRAMVRAVAKVRPGWPKWACADASTWAARSAEVLPGGT